MFGFKKFLTYHSLLNFHHLSFHHWKYPNFLRWHVWHLFPTSNNSKIQTFCGTQSSPFVVWNDHVSSTHVWLLVWSQKLRLLGLLMCVYLQDYHHNLVSITWKHLKLDSSFHNSLLKNQRIKWWKQNLKTQPNRLPLHRSHNFWVMRDENKVMGDGNTKIQTAPNPLEC